MSDRTKVVLAVLAAAALLGIWFWLAMNCIGCA